MTTHHTSGAADLHRVIDDFERRERGIPQAHIAAALVTELRAALTAQAISAEPAAHVQNPAEIEHVAGDVSKAGPKSNMAQQPSPTPQADSHPAPALDEREAFELWARPRGLQLRRNEALGHYGNIDTQRCWEGWQARAPADSVTAPAATPTAASIAWTALRDLTDPLGEAGVKIMGHVRIFAQRQYEAGRDEVHFPVLRSCSFGVL